MIPTPPATPPPPVAGGDPTRVGGRRVVACLVDVGLLVVLYSILFIVLSRQAPVATWVGRSSNICVGRGVSCAAFGHRYVDGGRRFVLQLFALTYLVGVFVLQRGLTGSTLGTRLASLVTVGHDGQPLGPLRALLRSVAGIVDYLPCCFPLVGIVTIFATTGHRRVGDMAASSLVVDRRLLGTPIRVPGLDDPTGGVGAAATAPGPPTAAWAAATTGSTPPVQPYQPPVPPPADAAPLGTASATPPPPADPTQPQWDAARGAYIQWDQVGQRWMQFDQATQQWQPIA